MLARPCQRRFPHKSYEVPQGRKNQLQRGLCLKAQGRLAPRVRTPHSSHAPTHVQTPATHEPQRAGLLPALERSSAWFAQGQVGLDLAMVGCALERFRLARGHSRITFRPGSPRPGAAKNSSFISRATSHRHFTRCPLKNLHKFSLFPPPLCHLPFRALTDTKPHQITAKIFVGLPVRNPEPQNMLPSCLPCFLVSLKILGRPAKTAPVKREVSIPLLVFSAGLSGSAV